MKKLKFYDLKKKKSFMSDKYKFVTKNTSRGKTYFVKTIAPSGIESWRIVGKDWYMENKK